MQTLFDNGWQGDSCAAIALQVAGIALAAVAAVAVIIGIILWIAARRGVVTLHGLRRPMIGIGSLVLGVIAFALLAGGTTNRILVTDTALVFEGCEGLDATTATVPFAQIASVGHRTRRGGGRSGSIHDELVLSLRGEGGQRVIPLSTRPEVMDLALLRRLVPAGVIEAWRDSLAQRGGRLPAEP